jgi:hypothetical protein
MEIMDRETAEQVVDAIMVDMRARRGFRQLLDEVDDLVSTEIREDFIKIVMDTAP